MRFDFSDIRLKNKAFDAKSMAFLEPRTRDFFATVLELAALETGDRRAREHWQALQLRNLLAHATQRSAFWRSRIGARKANDVKLSSISILHRRDVAKQVEEEGALILPGDGMSVIKHATSGSSGVPIRFFVSEVNGRYNIFRSITQYFIEGRDLRHNRTRFKVMDRQPKNGFVVEKSNSWLGPIGESVKCGTNKDIQFLRPDMTLLRKELQADSIGYLAAGAKTAELLLQNFEIAFLKRAGLVMWIPLAEAVDSTLREQFVAGGIDVRATYSSEEVGPIGHECEIFPGHYHVASSNVIVELAPDGKEKLDADTIGRVLVTHLHSYATPFIRYDIGDLATLKDSCPCGHDSPTLCNVFGRTKGLIKRPDGSLTVFFVRGGELKKIADFDEYRIRQVSLQKIVVEIGGRETLSPDEIAGFVKFVNERTGGGFDVEVCAVKDIAWGENVKRLGFHNELL
jgi:phenylacetate-coenzyme A ligase PaaK-like adenylate-forming protein